MAMSTTIVQIGHNSYHTLLSWECLQWRAMIRITVADSGSLSLMEALKESEI